MLKSLPPILRHASRQPTFWSAIAAIGVHGALWAVLPILPSASQTSESENQRPVGLVELTPEEQSRLPAIATMPVIPAPAPEGSDLYPLAPLPNDSSSLLAPPPLPSFSVPSYNFPTYPLPSFPPILPPPPISSVPRDRPTTPSPSPRPTTQPSASPDGVQPTNPGTIASSALDNLRQGSNSPSQAASPNAENASPNASPNAEEQRRIATENLVAEQRRLRELYSYNTEGTGQGAGTNQLVTWFQTALRQPIDNLDDVPEIALEPDFPREACPIRLEESTEAWFGVVVDAEGKIAQEPQLLRSSGYGILNAKALEAIRSFDFKDYAANNNNDRNPLYEIGDGNKLYFVKIRYERDADRCPAVAAPPTAPAS